MNAYSNQRGSFAFLGLIVLAGIFIFLAWWVRSPEFPLRNGGNNAQLTEEKKIENGVKYRVEITDKGFVPEVVTVAPYDTISFINRDARAHWPVSGDLDGEHACAEFGQGRELQPGEGYSVLFKEENQCAFSDKLEKNFSAGTIFIQK